MNSFRFVQRGIEAELERQRELIGAGGTVEQETLHFDPLSGDLTSLRSKEEAHDYRYFPEPDLVAIVPTEAMLAEARDSLPELPAARTARYESELGLDGAQARLLAGDPDQAAYFEAVVEAADQTTGGAVEARTVANWVTGDLTAALRASEDAERPEAQPLADLIGAVAAKTVSHAGGKQVLAVLVADGDADVAEIIEREGLAQMGGDDGELSGIVAAAIEADPAAAEQIRSGNGKAIGAIVGAVMRETKGRADGGEVNRLIREHLGL
jgi:aspartyl-tRNA(Asn)/glutamyl-tRNA(Gln) amidotransferase subunit B